MAGRSLWIYHFFWRMAPPWSGPTVQYVGFPPCSQFGRPEMKRSAKTQVFDDDMH